MDWYNRSKCCQVDRKIAVLLRDGVDDVVLNILRYYHGNGDLSSHRCGEGFLADLITDSTSKIAKV